MDAYDFRVIPAQRGRCPIIRRQSASVLCMRVLHILDHSIPLHSGYAFRTLAILKQQRALQWETFHLTGPKQGSPMANEEAVDGWNFYRTPQSSQFVQRMP